MGDETILDAAYNRPAVVDTVVPPSELTDVSEFGYSYWFRFMS